jgi:hypothetical protein
MAKKTAEMFYEFHIFVSIVVTNSDLTVMLLLLSE